MRELTLDKKMKPLNFLENYNNKLNCNAFTTMRINKRLSSHIMQDKVVEINLKGEFFCYADVVDFCRFTLKELPKMICFIDTGMSRELTWITLRDIYGDLNGDSIIYVYTLKKVEKDLFGNWEDV